MASGRHPAPKPECIRRLSRRTFRNDGHRALRAPPSFGAQRGRPVMRITTKAVGRDCFAISVPFDAKLAALERAGRTLSSLGIVLASVRLDFVSLEDKVLDLVRCVSQFRKFRIDLAFHHVACAMPRNGRDSRGAFPGSLEMLKAKLPTASSNFTVFCCQTWELLAPSSAKFPAVVRTS